jgi:hypothetical protein
MPPLVSKLKGKKLHSQTRQVIYNVPTFMEAEARNKDQECTAANSRSNRRVSHCSAKIKREGKRLDVAEEKSFSTPIKKC